MCALVWCAAVCAVCWRVHSGLACVLACMLVCVVWCAGVCWRVCWCVHSGLVCCCVLACMLVCVVWCADVCWRVCWCVHSGLVCWCVLACMLVCVHSTRSTFSASLHGGRVLVPCVLACAPVRTGVDVCVHLLCVGVCACVSPSQPSDRSRDGVAHRGAHAAERPHPPPPPPSANQREK